MARELYRKEAFQSKIKGFSNPVSIRGSLSATVMTLGLLAILGALVAYGWTTPYTRKVTAPGFVVPSSGSIAIKSPSTGVVRIMVSNGETIEKGDVLAVITDTLEDGSGSVIALQLKALRARRDLLDQRIELSKRRLKNTERSYTLRIENAERQIVSRQRILDMQRKENDLAISAGDRMAYLVKRGVSARSKLDESRTALIVASQRLIDAETTALEAVEAVEAARIEREIELNMLKEELIGQRSEWLNLSNEIDRLEAERKRKIAAPVDGVVTFSRARNFERVDFGEPLFTIDSADDAYIAIVLAPSSAIGFVKLGDLVPIRYDAYPYREHGTFRGKITAIDNTAQLPQAISAPIGGMDPIYRVYVEIDQEPINKRGEGLRLISGMVFEASIVADEKPLLYWLLDPVL